MLKLKNFFLFLLGKQPCYKDEKYLPEISVVIPAYNEEKIIAKTIQSIQRQTYPLIKEIIVVDDSSTDQTGEIAKKLGAKVIRTPQNTGTKPLAQNFGLQYVESEVVIFVDADTILEPNAIQKLIPALADGETFSACGFVLPQDIKTFWELVRLVQYLYYIGLNKKAQNHLGITLVSSGCFSAYNLKMLKEMGGFPSDSIAEDMNVTWQALLQRKKIKLVPEAICYPKDPENWKKYKAQTTRWYRGFLQCIGQHRWKLIKRPLLGFFIFYYLITGLLNPIFYFFFLYMLFASYHLAPIAFGLIFAELLIWFVVVMINAIRYKVVKKALLGMPLYWLEAPIETYLFLYSVYYEWIKRKKLTVWEKGH